MIDGRGTSSEIAINVTGFYWWLVNCGSDDYIRQQLTEPMLFQIYVAFLHHLATLSSLVQNQIW